MRQSTGVTLPALVIAALLFFLTYFFYESILTAILPNVTRGIYPGIDAVSEFRTMMIFCFTVSLTPLFIAGTWAASPINSANNRLLAAMITTGCAILAVFYRYHSIEDYLLMMTQGTAFNIPYLIEDANFAYYILGGLFGGSILSYLFFKER